MAADPLIYCLEHLTDYDQFERLCHDLMALEGHRQLEPLGGSKDKGRDAIHVDRPTNGQTTIFAYSVREDWRKKLEEDSRKIQRHGHPCHRLVFLCTATFTATERDEAVSFVRTTFGWPLDLYGLERLRLLLTTTCKEVVAHHPSIFCQPFFPTAAGLSLSHSADHLVIDHVDADSALAFWRARPARKGPGASPGPPRLAPARPARLGRCLVEERRQEHRPSAESDVALGPAVRYAEIARKQVSRAWGFSRLEFQPAAMMAAFSAARRLHHAADSTFPGQSCTR
jgi:hypothetical protein